ncbi:helix-turn-helix transcriptional regulator [Nostocaceae cyanobacterium CENA357]|uniref:Helix-turn-helix transcriptional regulator n=1 Tax=Atlanticothrix silvestris CENA357 TaxID=1725252 RepID=A0A8J7HLB1_9CYAN|nr:helix-turn-helix transcriptional regulator [Atlanticothrix silvestris]MBH8554976.1 helix-turn-helix transcriptional regulator [Atlanticothrix silvestris CENA357]
MIAWRLNEIMAKRRIKNKDLAAALGIDENSVHRLRRTDEMPRLTAERLNGLCIALECNPGDLIVFIPDDETDTTAKGDKKKVTPIPVREYLKSKADKSQVQDIAA